MYGRGISFQIWASELSTLQEPKHFVNYGKDMVWNGLAKHFLYPLECVPDGGLMIRKGQEGHRKFAETKYALVWNGLANHFLYPLGCIQDGGLMTRKGREGCRKFAENKYPLV